MVHRVSKGSGNIWRKVRWITNSLALLRTGVSMGVSVHTSVRWPERSKKRRKRAVVTILLPLEQICRLLCLQTFCSISRDAFVERSYICFTFLLNGFCKTGFEGNEYKIHHIYSLDLSLSYRRMKELIYEQYINSPTLQQIKFRTLSVLDSREADWCSESS